MEVRMSNPIRDEWQSEDGAVRLILGDCLDVLPTLAIGADWGIVADPPYGVAYKRPRDKATIAGDDAPFDPAPLLQLGLPCVLWGANEYANRLPKGRWLVWVKRAVEVVRSAVDFGDAEIAWCSIPGAVRCKRHISDGCIREGEEHGIVRCHPAQKPVRVMAWCLGFLPACATIVDTHMGSGTTGIACVRMQRHFVGIELEREHWETAVRRVRAELERFPLFEAVAKPRQLELLDAGDGSVSVPDCPG